MRFEREPEGTVLRWSFPAQSLLFHSVVFSVVFRARSNVKLSKQGMKLNGNKKCKLTSVRIATFNPLGSDVERNMTFQFLPSQNPTFVSRLLNILPCRIEIRNPCSNIVKWIYIAMTMFTWIQI